MKDFKYIQESIFDDDDIVAGADKVIIEDWIKNNVKGDFKYSRFKDGTLKIKGNFIIRNYKEDVFPIEFNIRDAEKGAIYIENCPNLKSIKGLFYDRASIDSDLIINGCDSLVSLEGCPEKVNNFICSNNKSLKSLDGMPSYIIGQVTMIKNGKKFKENQLKSKSNIALDIYCSVDNNNENIILEDFSNPVLSRLFKFMKEKNINRHDIDTVLYNNISWDKLGPSANQTYRYDDKKGLTAARNIIRNGYGLVILMDINKEFTHIINGNNQVLDIKSISRYTHVYRMKYTEIMELFDKCYEFIVIDLSKYNKDIDNVSSWQLSVDRRKSKEGMLNPGDEEQNRKIKNTNIERYKAALADNRIYKDINYDDVIRIMTKINELYNKFISKSSNIKNNAQDVSYMFTAYKELSEQLSSYFNDLRWAQTDIKNQEDPSYPIRSCKMTYNNICKKADYLIQKLNKLI